MQHQEKKFRVDSFDRFESKLAELGVKKKRTTTTTHFYAQQSGNSVTKLVVNFDKSEIHKLKESHGRFSLQNRLPMESKKTGLQWLKEKGHDKVGIVKMTYAEFAYKGGAVGLYTINDFLYSIILDFPPGQHEIIQQELELEDAEMIEVPYNKYLEQLGRLESIQLD